MNVAIKYEPQPRQCVFHECYAEEILYGGAAGGGKSQALINDAMGNAMRHKNCRIIMFRRTFPDLKRSLIQRSYEIIPKELATYNQADKVWTFINGSTIEFAYWDNDANYTNYQGAEYDFIYWDELTQFKKEWYLYMLSRLRGDKPIHRQCKSATNPGGIGHGWVLDRWIDKATPEKVWRPKPTQEQIDKNILPLTRCFIPATIYDNPKLLEADPQYLARLMSLPEQEKRALLEGDWHSFAGQYFKQWRNSKHVIEPFKIPEHWRRYRSIDYGFNDPTACYWHAVDQDGRTYTYRELYLSETLASDLADMIVEMSQYEDENGKMVPEKIDYTVASPDMWQKRGAAVKAKTGEIIGQSIAEEFAHHGVPLIQADNSRVVGWQRMREVMKDAPDGKPHWQVFSNCRNLIRTLPVMVHDKKKVEDISDGIEDHACESVRYFFMSRPSKTKIPEHTKTVIQRHKEALLKQIKQKKKRLS